MLIQSPAPSRFMDTTEALQHRRGVRRRQYRATDVCRFFPRLSRLTLPRESVLVSSRAVMNGAPKILLTGFTGILGKRFAYRLAALGYEVICPIRASTEQEAKNRFQSVFHGMRTLLPDFDESLSTRIRAIPGDVRQKGLGIASSFLEELRGPRTRGI